MSFVLLCQVRKLQEDFPEDFPPRLSMSILGEAAATAETYVPLVIRTPANDWACNTSKGRARESQHVT